MTISRGAHNDENRRLFGPPPSPKGEIDAGGKFAPIPGVMVKHLKAFNVQCAHYSTQSIPVANLLMAQIDKVKASDIEKFSVDRNDFIDLIALANIGRQYLLFMEKESKELMVDSSTI